MPADPELIDRALAGIVERIARSPHAKSLVLHGGLVVRPAIAPAMRAVDAVEVLGTGPLDARTAETALREILDAPADDEIDFAAPELSRIHVESESPGLRAATTATVGGEEVPLRVDVSFGDPLVLDPIETKVEGTATAMKAAALEDIFVWKVHALFERGHGQWAAQDLVDVWLLGQRDGLDDEKLPEALHRTFKAHGDGFAIMDRFLGGPWGTSSGSRAKWQRYVESRGDDLAPEDMQVVVAQIRERIIPIVAAAVHLEE